MKIRYNPTSISAVLQSMCLALYIRGSLRYLSTWREATFHVSGYNAENLLMPLGSCFVGVEMIGLIVLWTAYRKQERWAWFVMFIILVCFFFAANMVPLVRMIYPPYFQWSIWLQGLRTGDGFLLMVPLAVLPVLVMSIALVLPLKDFFWNSAVSPRTPKTTHP
jgi:hypothetical protein